MKKLLMLLASLALAEGGWAACSGPYCYDDTGASIDATLSVAGNVRIAAVVGATTMASTTPSAVGILAIDSSNNLYISTGTARGAWQKVGAQ